MSLKNRRGDYTWPPTSIGHIGLTTDRKSYSTVDTVKVNLGFRVVGGLREAFHPDVWTLAWEDFDKILRLTLRVSVKEKAGLLAKRIAGTGKEVRKASFYWSRDPDLPYRIWAMIVPEDGGPPKIPRNVDDAKSMMLDVEKTFEVSAAQLGAGRHRLTADGSVKWPRKSFIEQGSVKLESKEVVIDIGE